MTPPVDRSTTTPKIHEAPSFTDPARYSAKISAGAGFYDLGNDQGKDHSGPFIRLAAGMRFEPARRHSLTPRLFFEYQGLSKDLGDGIRSEARSFALGAELDYGFAIHPKWFSIHAILGIGAAIYRSPQSTNGLKGAEFDRNPQLGHLSSAGLRLDLGAQACTWKDILCAGLGFALDSGLNPKLDVVDGRFPAQGLSPQGIKIGVGLDVLRLIVAFRKKPEAAPVEATPAIAQPVPAAVNVKPEAKAPRVTIKIETPKAAVNLEPDSLSRKRGLARFEQVHAVLVETERDTKRKAAVVKTIRDRVLGMLKRKPPNLITSRELLNQGFTVYREAYASFSKAEKLFMHLQKEARDLPAKDLPKASRLLKKIRSLVDGIYLFTTLSHGYNAESARNFNVAVDKKSAISFSEAAPSDKPKWKNNRSQ